MPSPSSLLRRVKKSVGGGLLLISGQADTEDVLNLKVAPGSRLSRTVTDGWRTKVIVLVLLQVALGLTHENGSGGVEQEGMANAGSTLSTTSAKFVILDALKLVCCTAVVYSETRKNSLGPSRCVEVEAQPLRTDDPEVRHGASKSLLFGPVSSNIAINIALVALLFVTNTYLTVYIATVNGHLASIFAPLFSAAIVQMLFMWKLSSQQWLGALLQILGLVTVESQSSLPTISASPIALLLLFALSISLTCVTTHYVYILHDTPLPAIFNCRLFALGLLVHLVIFILSNIFAPASPTFVASLGPLHGCLALGLRAAVDIASLNLMASTGAVLFGMATSLSTSILLGYSTIMCGSTSVTTVCGLAVALLGFYTYWEGDSLRQDSVSSPDPDYERMTPSSRWLFPAALLSILGVCALVGSDRSGVGDGLPWHTVRQDQSATFTYLAYVPPLPSSPPPFQPICTRVPLPSEQYFAGNRTYHEFDDVLLIVFFSHARYDVNLDYYKEVYAEYFPNIVFVGPRTREDKGFEHSYDVLVDSYESDEDISDWRNYKMAGRMAHHMLYTVLTTPPYSTNCYRGYLWAPFDTLLNVPRLQMFDQNRLWYISPWGEYVPNPAVHTDLWMNASNHAPVARISPDPEIDFNKTYRGWWVDWWWGDPNYGIPACKPAFEAVSLERRERMANRFTNNVTRYIGGSADTLYVPARLADEFVDLLGTFLNTSCFLEIAVPTVVHLLVPEDEDILFVDHWWIWNSPFNASFVRERWKRGMEVDTFHTFHWGDKGPDGVWRGILEHVEDVRNLFRESAARQGIAWPSLRNDTPVTSRENWN